MPPVIPNAIRDTAVTAFRSRVCERMHMVPYPHQAEWWAAADGLVLTDQPTTPEDPESAPVRLQDGQTVHWKTYPRPGGPARFLADLGAFKIGKSYSAAMWATGFAAVPEGRVSLVGLEYDICAPEFEYLCTALLSDRGMGINCPFRNRPREGAMWIDLPNGCRYEAKSWERKDSLKGKEVDAYIFCEAFMLPGLECFTGVQQNLAARAGYALFPTTPDRPWVKDLHLKGHGVDSEWHCTCNVPRSQNPLTFNQREMDMNDPDKGGMMTREKFAIAYLGRLGDFVGQCYNYQRGDATYHFTTQTHPSMWMDPQGPADLENLRVPNGWTVVGSADTGTFMAASIMAFAPNGDAFVLWENPNYRYVSNELDLDPTSSIPSWANACARMGQRLGVRGWWADRNSQYKAELRNNHGMTLLPSSVNLQTRTEIGREYFQGRRIYLAPWLKVLPYEIENAHWPEEETSAGRFERVKKQDHMLDTIEHILARRPLGGFAMEDKRYGSWAAANFRSKRKGGNRHMGSS